MNHNIFRTAVTVIALIGGQAHAIPTLYPTEVTKLSMIKNSTNSNLVMDSVDANRVYVMPPNTAEAQVGGLHTVAANVLFCEDLKTTRSYSAQMQERLKKLTEQSVDMKRETDEYFKATVVAREELGKFTESKDLNTLTAIDDRLVAIEAKQVELYESLSTCTESCNDLKEEVKALRAERAALLKDRRDFVRTRAADVRMFERKKNAVAQAEENYQQHLQSYDRYKSRLDQARKDFMNMFTTYGKMYGARASFSYQGNWDQNLEVLRADNAGVSFEKIQTSKVTIYPSLSKIENLPTDEAILSFNLPGQRNESTIELDSYPDSFNANIVLSLIGTCPLLRPLDFGLDSSVDVKSMKYGLATTFEFPTSFKLQVTAKYNMHKMYQKIVSSGSKGGFFSSRSWSKVEERNFFSDSFKVNWLEQDPSHSVSEEERLTIEDDLRKEIFTRIANMAIPTTIDRQAVLTSVAPGPHGAVVLSDALVKTCPANIYCAGGAILLNVLDAIFGSSSNTTNFTSIQDMELTETWSRDRVTMKPWVTIYNPTNAEN